MDNKYGLGSARVAHAHHEATHPHTSSLATDCRYCGSQHLLLCSTMNDHYCKDCGRYQSDEPVGYTTGRSADY